MKNQVLSIKQMQELQKLGLDTTKSSMGWGRIAFDEDNNCPLYDLVCMDNWIGRVDQPLPTFTLQDILELMPKVVCGSILYVEHLVDGMYRVSYDNICGFRDTNPLQAAYQMLVWCIENGHIEPASK